MCKTDYFFYFAMTSAIALTIAIMYIYSIINGLMWVVFEQIYIKLTTFSILQ